MPQNFEDIRLGPRLVRMVNDLGIAYDETPARG